MEAKGFKQEGHVHWMVLIADEIAEEFREVGSREGACEMSTVEVED